MEWRKIKNHECYSVSDTGLVKYNDIILKQSMSDRYPMVVIQSNGKRIRRRVHKLVAEAFIPNPHNKTCVNHIDGNKLNNTVSNLEWATHTDNAIHAYQTGLRTPSNKKRVQQYTVEGIFIAEYNSLREAADALGIKWEGISAVVRQAPTRNGEGVRKIAGGFTWRYSE